VNTPVNDLPKPSYQDVLATDERRAPEVLYDRTEEFLGSEDISIDRYLSAEWHELEVERVWKKVWQMVCRVEDLREVGDHVLYEIADQSLIIVRDTPDTIRAFHNACLHRGTTLRESAGQVPSFRCPFHGFTWSLGGELVHVPASWDFPHLDPAEYCLPEARVGVWGGFVFVNLDPDGEAFESYLEVLDHHFAAFSIENRYKAYHVSQVIDANWKTVMEAFLEGYHVGTTHPQTLNFAGDFNIQYDVYGRHVSRLLQAIGVPSPVVAGEVSENDIADAAQSATRPEHRFTVPEGGRARPLLADRFRAGLTRMHRTDLSMVSDAEILDSIQYFLFPNFHPWAGHGTPLAYRFRPYRNDPDRAIMEVMLLYPIPDDGNYEVCEMLELEPGASWTTAPGFENIGVIFDQDMDNLPRVQKGLHATRKPGVTLANYQEIRIRHFHHTLDDYLAIE